jgi:hypothetical protein
VLSLVASPRALPAASEGLTLRVKAIRRQRRLAVTGSGRGLVSRAGTGLVVETGRVLGLEGALAEATVGIRPAARHTPAAVLQDLKHERRIQAGTTWTTGSVRVLEPDSPRAPSPAPETRFGP